MAETSNVVQTSLGFPVILEEERWEYIVSVKHPVMDSRKDDVLKALITPIEVRRSRRDPNVLLFYRAERPGRWICVVVRRLDEAGTLITAYPTDAIKEGEQIWRR